jgi:hypothetical protein
MLLLLLLFFDLDLLSSFLTLQASEICKIILALIQKEIGVVTKASSAGGARVRILWLKVICANKAKLFPLRDSLKVRVL